MTENLKLFLKLICTFIFCFIVIYLIVLLGGWKLFESGDPILIEIGVSIVLSIFVFSFFEAGNRLEKKVKALEERLSELEKNSEKSRNINNFYIVRI